MDFVKHISTDAGQSEGDPKITTLKLARGRLTGGFLFFPSGPAGTLHFRARMGIHQLLPFNADGSYSLDDCVIPFHLGIDLTAPPYEIDLITWNTSEDYAHALTVGLFLTPKTSRNEDVSTLDAIQAMCEVYKKP